MTGIKTHNFIDAGTGKSVGAEYVTDGVAKMWGSYSADGTTIGDSFNVSSLTDNSTGQQYSNLTNSMANADYAGSVALQTVSTTMNFGETATAGQFRHYAFTTSSSYSDNAQLVTVQGDLA